MKKIISTVLVLTMVTAALAGCASKPAAPSTSTGGQTVPEAKPINLIVAHNQTSTENPYQYGMNKFKAEVEALSGGTITAEVHAGTIGTNESELIEKLTLGAADLVVASPGFMTQIGVKEVDLFSLLYLFDGFDTWNTALNGEFGTAMKDIVTEKTSNQFKIMNYWSSSVRDYYGKKPITTPADAKGLKIRTQSSPVQQEFWIACGAIPTSVDWNELYQALQQNTVDAAENDYTNFMLKDHHKTPNGKFVSETHHDYTTRLLLMNGQTFATYTDEQKNWIQTATNNATVEELAVCMDMFEKSKEKVIADGGVVNTVDLEAFKAIAVPIQDKFAEENNMVELLKMARAAK